MKNSLPSLAQIVEGQIILIDKPLNWTSFDAVNKLKYQIQTKIGHCGTLDPLATGLLICCTGKMTKQIQYLQREDKEYIAEIQLSATTASYDLETEPENHKEWAFLNKKEIITTIKGFLGQQEQIPPAHSAIKKDGVRAYKLARAGKEVKMNPRIVDFYALEPIQIDLEKGQINLRIHCSTGTYIRSFAHDLGQKLNTGAYLSGLRRTKVGDYHIGNASSIEHWVEHLEEQNKLFAEIGEREREERRRNKQNKKFTRNRK